MNDESASAPAAGPGDPQLPPSDAAAAPPPASEAPAPTPTPAVAIDDNSPAARRRRRIFIQTKKKAEFVHDVLVNLDMLIYAEICFMYYHEYAPPPMLLLPHMLTPSPQLLILPLPHPLHNATSLPLPRPQAPPFPRPTPLHPRHPLYKRSLRLPAHRHRAPFRVRVNTRVPARRDNSRFHWAAGDVYESVVGGIGYPDTGAAVSHAGCAC